MIKKMQKRRVLIHSLAHTTIATATSIYECTEAGASGTCSLTAIQTDNTAYEQFKLGNDPTEYSRINTTHNTILPSGIDITKVEVCIAAFSAHSEIMLDR